MTSGGVAGGTVAVRLPDGVTVGDDVVLGVPLGVAVLGVVDVTLGSGVRLGLSSERGAVFSVGDGAGTVATGCGGGRTRR